MIIKSMRVKNFRSIQDETLHFDNLTALVGANGSGKSSFLHAMELFHAKQPKIIPEDFYNKNINNEIVISITFTTLSNEAKELFSKYVQNDELTIEHIFKFMNGKLSNTWHGSTLQNPDFLSIRYSANATSAKAEYAKLVQKQEYGDFPTWKSFDETKYFLSKWEIAHSDKCKWIRDDGQFFGYDGVGSGYLGKYIKFLYIPAVRDAVLDASEGKNSTLTSLIDLVIRNDLLQREDVQKFQTEIKEKYEKILGNDNLTEIVDLSRSLTETLNSYVPDAKIDLSWLSPKPFEIEVPSANANLIEDGYSANVERTGHGLQRVFIMTMLQHLAIQSMNRSTGPTASSESTMFVLIIEEPELYQHPSRQRHLSEIFLILSKNLAAHISSNIQIVYSTHSPHFVGLDRINQIRLLRKQISIEGEPKVTKIFSTNIQNLTEELSKLHGDKFTVDNIIPRLHMIRTPWINEGFFSKCVVLVEGEGDRAAILGASKLLEINLESNGVSIIPCSGKGNLDKPAIIFRQLGIPTYVIWDNDKEDEKNKTSEIKNNRILLKLFEEEEMDYPSHVKDNHACLEGTLESTLEKEIGNTLYSGILQTCMTEYDLKKSDAIKNPIIIFTMLEDLKKSGGKIPETLEQIIQKIQKLNQQ